MAEAPSLHRVKALFEDRESFEMALGALKDSPADDYEAYGPTNLAKMAHLMRKRSSPVRAFATIGAITGLVSFFYMCVATSLVFKIITGGKPPWSNVPFVVPTYEGTILLGAIGAFLATLFFAVLYGRSLPLEYDRRFTGADYGINVYVTADKKAGIVELLKNMGAVEIDESAE